MFCKCRFNFFVYFFKETVTSKVTKCTSFSQNFLIQLFPMIFDRFVDVCFKHVAVVCEFIFFSNYECVRSDFWEFFSWVNAMHLTSSISQILVGLELLSGRMHIHFPILLLIASELLIQLNYYLWSYGCFSNRQISLVFVKKIVKFRSLLLKASKSKQCNRNVTKFIMPLNENDL